MSDYQPTPPPSTPYTGVPAQQKTPVLSILALIFGIIGLLGGFLYGIGLLPAIAGVVLGFLGRRKEPAAKGLWLTGIITGFVGIGLAILVIIGVIIFFAALAAHGGFNNVG